MTLAWHGDETPPRDGTLLAFLKPEAEFLVQVWLVACQHALGRLVAELTTFYFFKRECLAFAASLGVSSCALKSEVVPGVFIPPSSP